MASTLPSVGVVGAGRVGAVLAAALRAVGHPLVAAAGESAASRLRIETLLPGVPVTKPSAAARAADVLLVTVPDDALATVVRMLSAAGAIQPGGFVIHTSGRHGLAVLAPARERGARGIALHPVMTFTGTDLDLARLPGCVYGLTCDDAERPLALQLVDELGGTAMDVPEEARGLYHTALAHGANHLVTLVAQAVELLRASGAADPATALRPLLTAALDNALDYEDAALTGPVVRGDVQTVAEHLRTLADRAPDILPSYVAMARATVTVAARDGRLDARRARALRAVLDAAAVDLPA